MDPWLDSARQALAKIAGIPPEEFDLDDGTVKELLDLARIAAHESGERTNAPLLAYMVGVAVGRGADFDEVAAAATSSR